MKRIAEHVHRAQAAAVAMAAVSRPDVLALLPGQSRLVPLSAPGAAVPGRVTVER